MRILHRWPLLIKHFLVSCAALASLSTIASAQDAAPKTAGSENVISGRISSDSAPITNARVIVNRFNANSASQIVRIDSTGAFQTKPLEPGLYSVSALMPGLIRETSGLTTPIFYRPGDKVDIKFVKGAVITGSVKNASGDPLVGVPVRAIRIRGPNGDPLPVALTLRETQTDDRGVYRLYGLLAGTYVVSAGGPRRQFGPGSPSAYEGYAPTFAPSATRDTATQIQLNNGEEVQADVQFREERGHVISGTIAGATTSDGPQIFGTSVTLVDPRNRAEVASATASNGNNFGFALYGVQDGEYEVNAVQASASGEQLASPVTRIKVEGADVTGVKLTVAPLASLEGRVTFENDPKAACGKHRASALAETIVSGRRYEPSSRTKDLPPIDVPLFARNVSRSSPVDSRGVFSFKSVHPGTYQIDATAPAPGWYIRAIAPERAAPGVNIPRDGISIKRGDRISGVTVTFTEGAAKLTGRITTGEGQAMPVKLRVYLVPSERTATDNILRFFEKNADADGKFSIDNVAPGSYWIVANLIDETPDNPKSIRRDAALRTQLLQQAQTLKKTIAFKPCEQVADFELPYVPAAR